MRSGTLAIVVAFGIVIAVGFGLIYLTSLSNNPIPPEARPSAAASVPSTSQMSTAGANDVPGAGATCAQYIEAFRKGDVKLWLAWGDMRWGTLDDTEKARGKPAAGRWLGNTAGAAEGLSQICLQAASSGLGWTFYEAVTVEYDNVYSKITGQRADVWDFSVGAPSDQVIAKDHGWYVRKDEDGYCELSPLPVPNLLVGLQLHAYPPDKSGIVVIIAMQQGVSDRPVRDTITSGGTVLVTAVKPAGRPAAIALLGPNIRVAAERFLNASDAVTINFDDGEPSSRIDIAGARHLLSTFTGCATGLGKVTP